MQHKMHLPAGFTSWLDKLEALKIRPVKDVKQFKLEADALLEELAANIHAWMDQSHAAGLTQGTKLVEKFLAEHEQARIEAAHKDEQTGLFNKKYFETEGVPNFVRNVVFDKRDQTGQIYDLAALWFLDVNNLKLTNDELGHDMGDKLIQRISDLLREHVRDKKDGTISGRLGAGDEFALLQTKIRTQREAFEAAHRIMAEFSGVWFWKRVDPQLFIRCPPSVSIGVAVLRLSSIRNTALSPDDITTAWFKAADQNMYYCKHHKLTTPCLHAFDYRDGELVKCDLGDSRTLRVTQKTPG